jgi:hypothetical protein
MADLALNNDGPSPATLDDTNGGPISITNNTGAAVTLTMSHAGLINPSTGTSLEVPLAGFNGTVGSTGGTYSYSAGAELGVRTGTISID